MHTTRSVKELRRKQDLLIITEQALPRWCLPFEGGESNFVLPWAERRRLRGRAYRAQQKDHFEVCGALVAGRTGQLELWFLKNAINRPGSVSLSERDLRRARRKARLEGKRVLGTFHSHPVWVAVPGRTDIKTARVGSVDLIYDVCGWTARLWRISRVGSRKMAQEVPLMLETRGGRMRLQNPIEVGVGLKRP